MWFKLFNLDHPVSEIGQGILSLSKEHKSRLPATTKKLETFVSVMGIIVITIWWGGKRKHGDYDDGNKKVAPV
jgi:hypothetical protein